MPGQKRVMDDVLRLPFPRTPFFFLSFFLWQFSLPLPIFHFGIGPFSLVCFGLVFWFVFLWFVLPWFSFLLYNVSRLVSLPGVPGTVFLRHTPAGVMRFHRGGLVVRPMRRARRRFCQLSQPTPEPDFGSYRRE